MYNKIEDRKEANAIINSLKICDPAVGSGHFLVSALNEIIAIKSELRILSDRDGKRLKEYSVVVENDELIVTDEDGSLIEYNPTSHESQRVQETLFHEKQTIIENCLFGVDLNPNSVKICRLRLWIELLKNAYYLPSPQGEGSGVRSLETLPNIDINIKCGNSLISRYALDADLKQALKSSKFSIVSYRSAVDLYRNAENKEQKWEMEKLIASIKSDFKSNIDNPFKKTISTARAKVDNLATQINTKKQWGEKVDKKAITEFEKAVAKLKKLEDERDDIEANKIYENAFEWRFEFPEVLNDDGDFVGFDVVIGNPPYMMIENSSNEGIYLTKNFKFQESKTDLFRCFIERGHNILKDKCFFSFIIPSSILNIPACFSLRKFLLIENSINEIVNFYGSVFEEANVNNIILSTVKYHSNKEVCIIEDISEIPNPDSLKEAINLKKLIDPNLWLQDSQYCIKTNVSNFEYQIISKIEQDSLKLKDICKYTLGLQVYHNSIHSKEQIDNRVFHKKEQINETFFPETSGSQISKYTFNPIFKEYVSYGDWCYNKPDWDFCSKKRILIREILSPKGLVCATSDSINIPNKAIIIIIPIDVKYQDLIIGILNSRLIKFYIEKTTEKGSQRLFPRVSLTTISKLPLKIDNSNTCKSIVNNVNYLTFASSITPLA
ncbi:MAG: TaqI-like C-terminal specificity domain-containing protein [Paludibacter sp.]|nr:TaqI-like C-terminal specificity domain-containing protein [Paludibacter sp.]